MLHFLAELQILAVELFQTFVEGGVAGFVRFEKRRLLGFDLDDFIADFV